VLRAIWSSGYDASSAPAAAISFSTAPVFMSLENLRGFRPPGS
jgi:hypothetical protein